MIDAGLPTRACSLEIIPQVALVDVPVSIRLSGLAPHQPVTIRAQARDGSLKEWAAQATFTADAHGVVDVGAQKPVEGSYDERDPMGLFWSMSPAGENRPAFFVKSKATPLQVAFTAEVEGAPVASASVERLFATPGVTMVPLEEQGLVGALFLPAAPGPHPAAIILNGSDGGMHQNAAALLASRGYAALALAYFGPEDLPGELVNIPLEYFENAIRWLRAQPGVIEDELAVIGLSRGGELALLLGATFPEIKAVIAGAPSGILHAGIKNNNTSSEPAWTYHSEPLPYISYKRTFFDWLRFMTNWMLHRPFASKPAFLRALKQKKAVEDASIAVENIHGPVLLISGRDDLLWPSSEFSEMVIERLARHNHPYPYEHVCYENAGHFVCFPYALPSLPPMITLSPVRGMFIGFGGTPAANAAAAVESWSRILAFLRQSLQARK